MSGVLRELLGYGEQAMLILNGARVDGEVVNELDRSASLAVGVL